MDATEESLERPTTDYRHHTQQPWTLAMLKELANGPQRYEDVLIAGVPLVPPGRAYRTALKRLNKRAPKSIRVRREPSDRLLLLGARAVVADSITGLKQQGRVATYFDGDTKMVRVVRGQRIRRSTSRKEDMLRYFENLAPGTMGARQIRERWDTYDNFIKRIPKEQLPYIEVPYGPRKWVRRYKPEDVYAYETAKGLGEASRTDQASPNTDGT